MAFAIKTAAGEKVLLDIDYLASQKSEPFAFAITDRAVFIPAKKTLALTNDPYFFNRVPVTDVREVRIGRLRPIFLYIAAVVMVVAGLYTTIGMFTNAYGGDIYGWPIAITVGGLVLPFVARGRFGLTVTHTKGTYRWKPPLVVDRASKDRVSSILSSIVAASRQAGIRVHDERAG